MNVLGVYGKQRWPSYSVFIAEQLKKQTKKQTKKTKPHSIYTWHADGWPFKGFSFDLANS